MSAPKILSVAAARAAYDARRRLLELDRERLLQAMLVERPLIRDEFQLVIRGDAERFWVSETAMLREVFGDTWCDDDSCERCTARCDAHDAASDFIDAYHGAGIYCFSATLQQRDRLTGEWEDIDSCSGFFSTTESAPIDEIRETLTDGPSVDCSIVYSNC